MGGSNYTSPKTDRIPTAWENKHEQQDFVCGVSVRTEKKEKRRGGLVDSEMKMRPVKHHRHKMKEKVGNKKEEIIFPGASFS